ncbi:MAG: hypothetical protein WC700_14960 [Gemmatimonadaceae bacterium]|jgi:hypothetical protein
MPRKMGDSHARDDAEWIGEGEYTCVVRDARVKITPTKRETKFFLTIEILSAKDLLTWHGVVHPNNPPGSKACQSWALDNPLNTAGLQDCKTFLNKVCCIQLDEDWDEDGAWSTILTLGGWERDENGQWVDVRETQGTLSPLVGCKLGIQAFLKQKPNKAGLNIFTIVKWSVIERSPGLLEVMDVICQPGVVDMLKARPAA